jgi:hypothetical protein
MGGACLRAPPPRRALVVLVLAAALAAGAAPARADRQMDPELRAVVKQAIETTRCDGHRVRFGWEVFVNRQ